MMSPGAKSKFKQASFGWPPAGCAHEWPKATPGLLLFGLAFSTALGILGGLYPAIWAMRMMPMDAIRRG